MSDERGGAWRDEHNQPRRHHPATDRGHSVLRGGAQPDEWTDQRDVYGNQSQDPRGRIPRAQDRGYGDYRDQGYGYEETGQPGGYPTRGGRGYPEQAYPEPGYGEPGYGDPGYGQPGYGRPGGHPDQYGRPARGAHQTGQHRSYGDYGDQGEPGYGEPGYNDPGYSQPGYGEPGHHDPGYSDPRYADHGYGDQGYGDQGYADPRAGDPRGGYPERGRGHTDPRGVRPTSGPAGGHTGGQSRAGYFAGSNTGSFIEQGFDGMLDDRMTTTGRGRRIAAQPPDDDFYEPDDKPEKRRRGRSLLILIIVIIMLGGLGGGIYLGLGRIKAYFGDTPDYTGKGTAEVVNIQVKDGDSTTAIANTLFKADVVKSAQAFTDAAKKDPNALKIQVGWYKMHKQMSGKEALLAMEALGDDGHPLNALNYKVTVTEGEISVDIFADLAKITGRPVKEFTDAAKNPVALGVAASWFTGHTYNNRPFIKSIEGFLFPATYTFEPDETSADMLKDMVAKFNDEVKTLNVAAAAKALQMTPYELLITASIAQAEAQSAADMAGVTRVIYNRIYSPASGDAGDKLSIDSEVNYWLRITGHSAKDSEQLKASELHSANDPYNTHDKSGLPGGAIGNPGEDALKAAMHPDPKYHGYYYWQTVGTNPKVLFAKTYSQFQAQQK